MEKALAWVDSLRERSFVGAESRLNTIFELLRQMACGAETDPDVRLADLRGRRAALDAEINRVAGGDSAPGFSDLSVRVSEFAELPPDARTVFVVENEITYLAFPPVDDAVVIFGEGYAATRLEPLRWLAAKNLVYWGDIDTHGFAILNRVRHTFGHTRSILMDRATLLSHERQWVREPSPTTEHLDRLRSDESTLYTDLVEDAFELSGRVVDRGDVVGVEGMAHTQRVGRHSDTDAESLGAETVVPGMTKKISTPQPMTVNPATVRIMPLARAHSPRVSPR